MVILRIQLCKLNSLLLKKAVPTFLPRRMWPILFLIAPRKLGSLKRMIISEPELITLRSIERCEGASQTQYLTSVLAIKKPGVLVLQLEKKILSSSLILSKLPLQLTHS